MQSEILHNKKKFYVSFLLLKIFYNVLRMNTLYTKSGTISAF